MHLVVPKGGGLAFQAAPRIFNRPRIMSQFCLMAAFHSRRNMFQLASPLRANNSQYTKFMKRKNLFYSKLTPNVIRTLINTTRPSYAKCNRDPKKLKYVMKLTVR